MTDQENKDYLQLCRSVQVLHRLGWRMEGAVVQDVIQSEFQTNDITPSLKLDWHVSGDKAQAIVQGVLISIEPPDPKVGGSHTCYIMRSHTNPDNNPLGMFFTLTEGLTASMREFEVNAYQHLKL